MRLSTAIKCGISKLMNLRKSQRLKFESAALLQLYTKSLWTKPHCLTVSSTTPYYPFLFPYRRESDQFAAHNYPPTCKQLPSSLQTLPSTDILPVNLRDCYPPTIDSLWLTHRQLPTRWGPRTGRTLIDPPQIVVNPNDCHKLFLAFITWPLAKKVFLSGINCLFMAIKAR